tara:strand:- start:38780 stop:38995 length:216 start_codon:yes stop_codon:yes gene_type:complete
MTLTPVGIDDGEAGKESRCQNVPEVQPCAVRGWVRDVASNSVAAAKVRPSMMIPGMVGIDIVDRDDRIVYA